MVESALYTLLGISITLLFMLAIIPMIWRRAVRLTRKKVLGEMPISYSELQAEKDMQRAEQAIHQRRLEVSVESQQEQLTLNAIKIDRLNETIDKHLTTIAERDIEISGLKIDLTTERENIRTNQALLEQTDNRLTHAKATIVDHEAKEAELEENILHLETGKSEQKVELVAQETRMEALRQELSETAQERTKQSDARADAESKLGQREKELDHAKSRQDKQDEKISALQAELADRDTEISTLRKRINRLESSKTDQSPVNAARLAETEARRIEAETKISNLTLQLEETKILSSDEKERAKALKDLQDQNKALQSKLTDLTGDNTDLKAQIASWQKQQEAVHKDSPLSASEHSLRSEMKTIAAQVALATAQKEGNSSPISKMLKDAPKPKKGDDALDAVLSLTDRIMAMKETGESATNGTSKES